MTHSLVSITLYIKKAGFIKKPCQLPKGNFSVQNNFKLIDDLAKSIIDWPTLSHETSKKHIHRTYRKKKKTTKDNKPIKRKLTIPIQSGFVGFQEVDCLTCLRTEFHSIYETFSWFSYQLFFWGCYDLFSQLFFSIT